MQRYAVHVLACTYLKVPLPVLAEVRHHRSSSSSAMRGGGASGACAEALQSVTIEEGRRRKLGTKQSQRAGLHVRRCCAQGEAGTLLNRHGSRLGASHGSADLDRPSL